MSTPNVPPLEEVHRPVNPDSAPLLSSHRPLSPARSAAQPAANDAPRARVAVTAPALDAVTGVSTHMRMMLNSRLATRFELLHFQIGSEGRRETRLGALARYLLSPLELASFLRRQRPALLQLNTSINDRKSLWRDYVYHLVARLCGVPFILQMHGDTDPHKACRESRLAAAVLRRYLLAAESIVVLSSAEIERYRSFDARLAVQWVPNAIDVSEVARSPREVNLTRPLQLAFLGRLVWTKGLGEALDALRQLKDEGRKFEFVIAGTGQDERAVHERVTRLGLHEQVRFIGTLQDQAKLTLWLRSDMFVFPTHFEGLPYSLLEAMAAGCVPVATAVGAIPDVMADGVHGKLVALNDARSIARAIAALDDDRQQLARLSVQARQRALDHYSLERLADDFESLYRRSLGG